MEKPSELMDSLKPLIDTGELSQEVADKIFPALTQLEEANSKLYVRTKNAEDNEKTLKEQIAIAQSNKVTTETEPDVTERIGRLEQTEEKRQFGYQNNLSPEETDYVFSIARGSNKKPSEVLGDSFVKGGLDTVRKQKGIESATPRPSARAPMIEGKTFSELNPNDKRKNWSKATGAE